MATDQVKVTITAEDATRAAFNSVQTSLRSLKDGAASAVGALGAIGVGLSVAGIVGSIRTTVNSMDALNDASDRTGSSVEELSSLLNTLSPYGATLDQITDATSKLARAMAGADDETKGAGAAFAALGVETRDAAGNLRPTVDVLDDVARALAQYEDGTNKTVLVQQLFGKSGAALLPMLKDLAAAERAAATVTTEQAAAAEELNIQLGRLKVSFDEIKVAIVGPFLGALNDMIQQLRLGTEAAGGFWAAIGRFGLLYGPDKGPAERIEEISKQAANARARLAEAERQAEQSVTFGGGARAAAGARANKLRAELQQYERDIKYFGMLVAMEQRTNQSLRSAEDRGFSPRRAPAPRTGEAAGSAGNAAADAARRAAEAYKQLDELIAQADADDSLRQQAEAAKELAVQLDRAADAALRRIEAADRAELDANEGIRRDIEAIQDAVDPTRALYRELERVRDLVGAGLLPRDAGNARQAQILGQIDGLLAGELPKQIEDATSAARELGLTFTSAFEDAIVGGKKFSDVLKGLEADILRVLVRKAVTEPLLDGLFGKGKEGGLLTPFLSAIGLRAGGGAVSAGMPYIVGERGPELMVPRAAGSIVPNHALGGQVTNVYHYHIDSRTDRASIVADIQRAQLAGMAMQRDARARGNEAFA